MENINVIKDKIRGKFITFEGGEGTGKSTQSKLLVEYLNNNDIESIWTREPGGCDEAEAIRNLVISDAMHGMDGITELLLMYAARNIHTEKKIKPLLSRGVAVISDRYLDSSYAYQGFGYGMSLEKIDIIRKLVLDNFKPDLTIVLDIDVKIGLTRANSRKETNRFEKMDIEFHERVREGFSYICEIESNRCIKLNVNEYNDKNEIFNRVCEIILNKFS
jgi:dTMP kinase